MGNEKIRMKNILLAEDDPGDVELTLAALEENHLANKVARGKTVRRPWIISIAGENLKRAREAIPFSCCSITKCRRSPGWKC